MEQFTRFFFSQGVLGVFCLAEFIIIVGLAKFMYGEFKQLNEKYISDLRTSRDTIADPLRRLQDTADALVKKSEQSNELLINVLSVKNT